MKTYAILLDSNKAPQVIEFTAEQDVDKRLDYFYETIGCDCIDIVHTSLDDTCIVVDDEGLFKEPIEINIVASMLYGFQKHGQPIVGKGLLTAETCTMNGAECIGFSYEVAHKLAAVLYENYKPLLNVKA